MKSSHVIIMRMLTIFCVGIWVGMMWYFYSIDIGNGFMPKKGESETDCDFDDDVSFTLNLILAIVVMYVFSGIFCMIVSVSMVQFAATYWNFCNGFTKFLSQNAYTVYLIQGLLICPALWTWIQLLQMFGGPEIIFCDKKTVSKTHFGHNYLLFVAWIYVVVVVLVSIWPISWCIRCIPGLKKII